MKSITDSGHHALRRKRFSAKLLYLINAPAQRLAMTINAAGRSLAVVIDQGVKENKFSGGASTDAPAQG